MYSCKFFLITMITYTVKKLGNMALVEFVIEGGVLDPAKLAEAVQRAPQVEGTCLVCISGRGPVWLYGSLIHMYHYTKAVGVFEPRLSKCVVVATHDPAYKVGDQIPVQQ